MDFDIESEGNLVGHRITFVTFVVDFDPKLILMVTYCPEGHQHFHILTIVRLDLGKSHTFREEEFKEQIIGEIKKSIIPFSKLAPKSQIITSENMTVNVHPEGIVDL